MRKNPTHLLAWSRSAEFRAIARRQIQKLNAARAKGPRCSATAKSTGERCKQAAMPNGTCAFHGGRTPRGDAWHRVQWPKGSAPNATAKLNRKLVTLEKRAREWKRWLAQRSPEALVAYERWQASHAPGSAAKRASARERRRQDDEARALFQTPTAPAEPFSELRAIHDRIAELEAHIAAIDEAERTATAWTTGVFE